MCVCSFFCFFQIIIIFSFIIIIYLFMLSFSFTCLDMLYNMYETAEYVRTYGICWWSSTREWGALGCWLVCFYGQELELISWHVNCIPFVCYIWKIKETLIKKKKNIYTQTRAWQLFQLFVTNVLTLILLGQKSVKCKCLRTTSSARQSVWQH